MSQKTEQESGRRVRRMLQMILLLQESRPRSPIELSEHFGVSRRTVFRDIQLLRDSGFPVAHDLKADGYQLKLRLVQQAELQPMELIALAGGNPGSGVARIPFLRAARELALAKLTAGSGALTQAQLQLVSQRIHGLLAELDEEGLDEATVEAMIESWMEEARQSADA